MYTITIMTIATIIHIILHYNLEKEALKHEKELKFHLPEEENQFP